MLDGFDDEGALVRNMRSLRIVVRTASGTLPLVVAASVSALPACGKSERDDETSANTSAGSGGAAQGGAAQGGAMQGGGARRYRSSAGGIIIVTGGTVGAGGSGPNWAVELLR